MYSKQDLLDNPRELDWFIQQTEQGTTFCQLASYSPWVTVRIHTDTFGDFTLGYPKPTEFDWKNFLRSAKNIILVGREDTIPTEYMR